MQEKWTDQLNTILSDYEVTPPEGLWESLAEVFPASDASAKTDSAPHAPARGVPSRRKYHWVNIAAVIALLLSVGSGVWWLIQDENLSFEQQPPLLSSVTPKPYSTIIERGEAVSNPSMETSTSRTAEDDPEDDPHDDIEDVEAEATAYVAEETSDSIAGNSRPDLSLTYTPDTYTRESYTGNEARSDRAGGTSSRFSIGLLTAYAGERSSSASSFIDVPPGDPNSNGPVLPPEEEITETHHDLPVRIGLTLQYPLTDRFSLESGLMYTFLSSKQSVIVPDTRRTVCSYRLHYLGIPLTVKYRLNRSSFHGFDAYLSAGGALEKCVAGSERTIVFNSDSRTITDASSPEHPWQWSLTAGAGLQYRPTPALGIYLEPGLTFYPRSRTTLPIIYRDRPLQFNLTLGLRFLLPR